MAYEFSSRIRYSETDSRSFLTLEALMNYFQDCSTFQSEDLGVGLEFCLSRGLAWVVASWHIEVYRYPKLLEQVTVGTFPHKFHAFLGERNFYMKDREGNYLAKANSIWTLIDLTQGKPAIPPEGMIEKYPLESAFDMENLSRKIRLPEGDDVETIESDDILVKAHHLDANNHVNNVQYIRMGLGCLPKELDFKRARVEYRKQAFLGTTIVTDVRKQGDTYTVSLKDQEGDVFVNLEFKI